jgi:hypothetical protein
MRVRNRMQAFANRRESNRAWLLHAFCGHVRAVAALLAAAVAIRSRHEIAGFVPERAPRPDVARYRESTPRSPSGLQGAARPMNADLVRLPVGT